MGWGFNNRSGTFFVLIFLLKASGVLPMARNYRNARPASDRSKASCHGNGIRINRVLCEKYSRRAADRLVDEGRVMINGVVACHGDTVKYDDFVKLDGKRIPFPINRVQRPEAAGKSCSAVYILYNKPPGIECTTDRSVRGNIVDAIGHKERIFPVGRLDKDTTGLILLTSNGDLPNACLRSENKRPKTYVITTERPVSPAEIKSLSQGVVITTTAQRERGSRPVTSRTRPCKVSSVGRDGRSKGGGRRLQVTLVEGRNRQIRKMLRAIGHNVKKLHRSSFMGMSCKGIPVGSWREPTSKEMTIIEKALTQRGEIGQNKE